MLLKELCCSTLFLKESLLQPEIVEEVVGAKKACKSSPKVLTAV